MGNGQKEHKIRPFGWRDVLLVQRLQASGQVLDYERALVDGLSPMRDALRAYLSLGAGCRRTVVLVGRDALAQYVRYKGSNWVRLTYLAPALTSPDHAERWIELLERLAASVGARGTYHIVAEASPDGPEMELLRRVGFGVLARQMLFRLASPASPGDDPPAPAGLRPWHSTDDWGVRLLYANTVPQLAQQIEAPADGILSPSRWSQRLVLERDGEVIACLATRRGRAGNGLRLLLHPEAEVYVEALIRHGLGTLVGGSPLPVYCRVRRYESWLRPPLEASGFELLFHTVLLVKHTVARVIAPEWNQRPLLEGRAEMTTPVTQAISLDIEKTGVD